MSKIFIISNTNFNVNKNLSTKEWLKHMEDYYNNVFVPYLVDNYDDNDILIHLGNFLYKPNTVDLNVLKFTQELFEKLAKILPVFVIEGKNDKLTLNIIKNIKRVGIIKKPTEVKLLMEQKFLLLPYSSKLDDIDNYVSDYVFMNIDFMNSPEKDLYISKLKYFDKCYNGFYNKNGIVSNIKNLGSPYNIDSDDKRGFIVLETHTNKDKFILNKKTPMFKDITLESIDDLEKLNNDIFENNYVSLNINKNLLKENKLKIEMLITENDIVNISYYDWDILKDKDVELDENALTLNEMVIDYIKKSKHDHKEKLINEFKNIIDINK